MIAGPIKKKLSILGKLDNQGFLGVNDYELKSSKLKTAEPIRQTKLLKMR